MKNTKIDWCDCTINPVMGCPRGCPYCYARKLNDRFGWVHAFEKPQFFPERLKALNAKKPKSVFLNSMSDVAYWGQEELVATLNAIKANPQHSYILLTKSQDCNIRQRSGWQLPFNVYTGLTITSGSMPDSDVLHRFDFLSIEPLLRPIKDMRMGGYIKQVIIGAETGNRKNKVIPQKEWVMDIVDGCDRQSVPVFMKESLHDIMGADFRQDRLIWQKT